VSRRRPTRKSSRLESSSTTKICLNEKPQVRNLNDTVTVLSADIPELEVAPAANAASIPIPAGDLLSGLGDAPDDGEQRVCKRHVRNVKTVVNYKDGTDTHWKEIIQVETVSRNGAALVVSKPCGVGKIVTLVMEMPRELRVYDVFADVYPIAGIVQNCTEMMIGETIVYHVGVAFIGKQLPRGYREHPHRSYRISGVASNGLWQVVEATGDFSVRRDPRFWVSIPITVSVRDEKRKVTERTVLATRDVSRGGMSIQGPLDVNVGARIKVSSKAYSFFAMAKVCNRSDHPRDETRSLVHVQFEDARFPVYMLESAETAAQDADELPDQ